MDDLDAPAEQRIDKMKTMLDELKIEIPGGLATQSTIACLDAVQQCLLSRQETLTVPSSFLIDPHDRLSVIYQGTVGAEQLMADAARAVRRQSDTDRNAPLPLNGRWFVNPLPVDILAIPRNFWSYRNRRRRWTICSGGFRRVPKNRIPPFTRPHKRWPTPIPR